MTIRVLKHSNPEVSYLYYMNIKKYIIYKISHAYISWNVIFLKSYIKIKNYITKVKQQRQH
jgi:hypothetical protein